ncbi:MAG: hypothetical protein NWF00_01055 [Candidatus Bathyarchaeota archaeon]|nr:hypothetical protein [Candidatus Bathyarchaeota archaeon]
MGEFLISEDEKKKEITVKAPSRPVVTPEEKAKKAAERALEEERYGVLGVPKRIGKYLGGVSLTTGVMLIFLLGYTGLSGQPNLVLLPSGSSLPSVGLWLFVGLISVIVGFLLVGSE